MNRKRTPPPVSTRAGLPSREHDHPPADELSRRSMLKLMGASIALSTGVAGCDRKPTRKILSRVAPPEYMKPGDALYYSSTWTEGSAPYGLLVKTVDGRPIALEGAPEHPLNRGAASAQMKAAILSLYDPDRLRAPRWSARPGRDAGSEITWTEADARIAEALRGARSSVLITRSTLGPSERALVARFLTAHPSAQHFIHEPLQDRRRRAAWSQLHGAGGELVPRFGAARVILSLGCDFLGSDGAVLEATREFAATRRPSGPEGSMSRLYVAESALSLTGMNADHRLRLRPSAQLALVAALRAALAGEDAELARLAEGEHLEPALLETLVKDLRANGGHALVVAGTGLPEALHAHVALLNESLGAPGRTLGWNPAPHALEADDPARIAAALARGVDTLVLVGVNPVHDWPGGGFEPLLRRARLSVGCDLLETETLAACHLALPDAHNLEAWNDAAPRPGVTTLCQPVIRPLFRSRQAAESLLHWSGTPGSWHDFLKGRWQREVLASAEEPAWEEALRAGGRLAPQDLAAPALETSRAEALAAQSSASPAPPAANQLELVIQPGHAVGDGRFAANAWLQELPDPVSRLVWDNAAALSTASAAALGVQDGDLLTLRAGETEITLPALIQPGTAEGVVATTAGAGRTRGGVIAPGVGVNAAPLAGAASVEVRPAGGSRELVRTQKQFSMHGRPIALDATLAAYRENPHIIDESRHLPEPAKIHEEFEFGPGPKWGMAIDLSCCTGCSGCVTACQAENNIPVVGREEVAKGREMHWLRIDLYREGDERDPTFHTQPVACQHCDNAPCESVCPVQATSHSPEGINEMTYNRCVGTRYCANNCPYKVRRFNFFDYQGRNLRDPVQELAFNPNVTVRARGVMEKCTFCIQRINAVRHEQKKDGHYDSIDGSIQTACQQACPAGAIVFGDVHDPNSRVAKLQRVDRAYKLLEELHVKPAVSYLARLRNPHPDLAGAGADESAAGEEGGHR